MSARLRVAVVREIVFGSSDPLQVSDELLAPEDHSLALTDRVGKALALWAQQQRAVLASLDQFVSAGDPGLCDRDARVWCGHRRFFAAAGPASDQRRRTCARVAPPCRVAIATVHEAPRCAKPPTGSAVFAS